MSSTAVPFLLGATNVSLRSCSRDSSSDMYVFVMIRLACTSAMRCTATTGLRLSSITSMGVWVRVTRHGGVRGSQFPFDATVVSPYVYIRYVYDHF